MKKNFIIFIFLSLVFGTATGLGINLLTKKQKRSDQVNTTTPKELVVTDKSSIKERDVFGSQNANNFKDMAEGYLEIGGHKEGEGTHKILRPGGISQNVYLTSSITDLTQFEGMTVKVWGETFNAQKAGWLMDVGRVEVIKIKGEKPFEAE